MQETSKTLPIHNAGMASTRWEAWCYWNNGAADRAARMANQSRPTTFWRLWTRHAEESMQVWSLYDETVQLQVAVAEFCTQQGTPSPDDAPPQRQRRGRIFTKFYNDEGWDRQVPPGLSQKFSFELASLVVNCWLRRVQSDAALLWIPLHYLYLDFQMSTGNSGPLKVQKMWVNGATRKFLAPETFSHDVRVRLFRAFLQCCWKQANIQAVVSVCRPDLGPIQAFIPCVAIRLDPWCVQSISTWLQSRSAETALRKRCQRTTVVAFG